MIVFSPVPVYHVGTEERHSFARVTGFHWGFLCESVWTTLGVIPLLPITVSSAFSFNTCLFLKSKGWRSVCCFGLASTVEHCATVIEEAEWENNEEASVFLGIIYLWWQWLQNCLRLLGQTRISAHSSIVIVRRVFTPPHRHLFFLQLQWRVSPLCYWTIGSPLLSGTTETKVKGKHTRTELR